MQLWPGAWNDTHADENPGSDGPVDTGQWYSDLCATQVTLGGMRTNQKGEQVYAQLRNHATCTSCTDGNVFLMRNIAFRAGTCGPSKLIPITRCYVRGVGNLDTNPQTTSTENMVCTKIVMATQMIRVSHLAADAREHYAAVEGRDGCAVALCPVFKQVIVPTSEMFAALVPAFTPMCSQTACDANMVCDVHKTVTCEKVCKLVSYNGNDGNLEYDSCNTTVCTGRPT